MTDFAAIWDRVVRDQQTQEQLDAWYEQDGRSDKSHPLHAVYTGLAEKYRGTSN
jgi:hypothetical protein